MKVFFYTFIAAASAFLFFRVILLLEFDYIQLNTNIKENIKKTLCFAFGFALLTCSSRYVESPYDTLLIIFSLFVILDSFLFSKDYEE